MFNLSPAISARSDLDWCWFLRRQGKSGEVLERALHEIGVLHPGGWANWGSSTLTATGAPVEIQFTAGQQQMHVTTEVADPASDPTDRMTRVCNVISALGSIAPTSAICDIIAVAQMQGPLQYGARLGLRHDANGLHCELHAEIPPTANDLSSQIGAPELGATIAKLDQNTQATQITIDCTTGHISIHHVLPNPKRDDLAVLAQPAQMSAGILATTLDNLANKPAATDLPVQQLGFAYTLHGANVPPVLNIEVPTVEIFQSDLAVVQRIKTCAAFHITGYKHLVDYLPSMSKAVKHHGKIAMTACPDATPLLSISVAAPWLCPVDAYATAI